MSRTFVRKIPGSDRHLTPITSQENEDIGEKMIQYLERTVKNEQAKSAYSSLVRIFGNEMKRKREEVLIKVSDD
ncbi:hypothetical protein QPM05_15090 [Caldibacillus thermoamylovorans]|nr:hypothetical protein [Caldibacillus thermoamylovorans]